jgi:thioredoxin reductase (NADPH)
MDYDVLVAGGGPAGMTAAIYTARSGWNTVLLDPAGGGGLASTTDMIYNYPGFPQGVPGQELMERMAGQATEFGTKVLWDDVLSVDVENGMFKVKSTDGEYLAKAVIYAAGTTPRRLNVPGEEQLMGKGISFCATCDGPLFRGKKVAVVGGGDSALTEADFLARFASEVVLIHRRDEFRASLASVNRVKANPKVKLLLSSTVEKINGEDRVSSLTVLNRKLETTSEVPVDGLFLYVGWEPNSKPIAHLVDLAPGGFVITAEDMTTKTPGLMVAGDIRVKSLRQVATAVGDGANAAWSAERYLLGH